MEDREHLTQGDLTGLLTRGWRREDEVGPEATGIGVGHAAPAAVMVTLPPAQIEVPVWLAGTAALVERPADARADVPVQPAATALTGDLDDDRAKVIAWADAGATHLLVRAGPEAVGTVARHLAPEVAMPGFPRVVAESPLPLPWPGTA